MILTARKVQEICRGIELLDAGWQKVGEDGKAVTVPYRDINVKTRISLAKNMALLYDDYTAFDTARRARIREEELGEDGGIKDPVRASLVEKELSEVLLEEKDYVGLRLIPQANLPIGDMSPTLIKMLLPILDTDD